LNAAIQQKNKFMTQIAKGKDQKELPKSQMAGPSLSASPVQNPEEI